MIKKIGITLIKIVAPFFYEGKYLKGKDFTESNLGWMYVLKGFFWQKVMRVNSNIPFPVNPNIFISNYKNLEFHPDDINNFQVFGVYYQNFAAKITIGKGTYIAPNVGLITSNHDPYDPDLHLKGYDIVLGEKCWIGMNSVILPGVVLGNNTVVAAGAVVTKSFKEGKVIIAGVPAKVIRKL